MLTDHGTCCRACRSKGNEHGLGPDRLKYIACTRRGYVGRRLMLFHLVRKLEGGNAEAAGCRRDGCTRWAGRRKTARPAQQPRQIPAEAQELNSIHSRSPLESYWGLMDRAHALSGHRLMLSAHDHQHACHHLEDGIRDRHANAQHHCRGLRQPSSAVQRQQGSVPTRKVHRSGPVHAPPSAGSPWSTTITWDHLYHRSRRRKRQT